MVATYVEKFQVIVDNTRGYDRGLDLKEQLAAAIEQSRPSDQS